MRRIDQAGKGRLMQLNPKWRLFNKLNSGVLLSHDEVPKSLHSTINVMLKRGVVAKIKPKGNRKFKYVVSNDSLFQIILKTEFPEGLDSIEFKNDSRESSAKRERDSKGTSIKVDSSLLLKVFKSYGEIDEDLVRMTKNHGLAAIDILSSQFIARGKWASIENHETFHFSDEKNCSEYDGVILLSGNPSVMRINWMKKSADSGCKFIHFADLDFYGIEHFSSINDSLGESVDLWNSPLLDVEYYKKYGDKGLFEKQKGEFNMSKIDQIIKKNENASIIFDNIKNSGYCIHQELVHNLFFI
jgi:hypothetical protein